MRPVSARRKRRGKRCKLVKPSRIIIVYSRSTKIKTDHLKRGYFLSSSFGRYMHLSTDAWDGHEEKTSHARDSHCYRRNNEKVQLKALDKHFDPWNSEPHNLSLGGIYFQPEQSKNGNAIEPEKRQYDKPITHSMVLIANFISRTNFPSFQPVQVHLHRIWW